jgi:hypothetical protein
MTVLLAVAGAVLCAAALVAPFSLLWIPGGFLLGWAWWLHDTRHYRAVMRRQRGRRGYLR